MTDDCCATTQSTTLATIATHDRVQSGPLVEVLYFDGCPNHEPALALVERVAAELDLHPEINAPISSSPAASFAPSTASAANPTNSGSETRS